MVRRFSTAEKRLAAEMAAERRGYEVIRAKSRGVPERARFGLRRPNEQLLNAVVRTTEEGLLGVRRDDKGEWKLKHADLVLVVMKSADRGRQGLQVLAFPKKIIVAALDAALVQLITADRRPPNEIPVFISVDAYNRPDLGHVIPAIRPEALWSEVIHREELEKLISPPDTDYIEQFRHEVAKRNHVDVGKVRLTVVFDP